MFISLEGIDGAGKTTISRMLQASLQEKGAKVFLTREPTERIEWNEKLRSGRDTATGISLFFRFTEDRYVHQSEIKEHLENGEIVLCDRYLLSSFAYQGAILEDAFPDRESTLKWMEDTSSVITVRPDITFYLDLSPGISMKRLSRRASLTGFEEEKYLQHVRDLYLDIDFNGKITIDGSRGLQQVHDEILEIIEKKLTL